MSTATVEAIRDQVRSILSTIDPTSLTSTRFRDARNEGGGNFRDWAEENAAACFRRYSVRNVGNDSPPEVSNMDFEERRLTLEILVAYPQNHRAGRDNAMDRDDLIEQDWVEIDYNVGLCGRANFGSTYDCTPLGCTKEIERGGKVDFLVIRAEFIYLRELSANGGLVLPLGSGLGG